MLSALSKHFVLHFVEPNCSRLSPVFLVTRHPSCSRFCSHFCSRSESQNPLISLVCHTCHGLKSLPAGGRCQARCPSIASLSSPPPVQIVIVTFSSIVTVRKRKNP